MRPSPVLSYSAFCYVFWRARENRSSTRRFTSEGTKLLWSFTAACPGTHERSHCLLLLLALRNLAQHVPAPPRHVQHEQSEERVAGTEQELSARRTWQNSANCSLAVQLQAPHKHRPPHKNGSSHAASARKRLTRAAQARRGQRCGRKLAQALGRSNRVCGGRRAACWRRRGFISRRHAQAGRRPKLCR
jgi:hypothetical protein